MLVNYYEKKKLHFHPSQLLLITSKKMLDVIELMVSEERGKRKTIETVEGTFRRFMLRNERVSVPSNVTLKIVKQPAVIKIPKMGNQKWTKGLGKVMAEEMKLRQKKDLDLRVQQAMISTLDFEQTGRGSIRREETAVRLRGEFVILSKLLFHFESVSRTSIEYLSDKQKKITLKCFTNLTQQFYRFESIKCGSSSRSAMCQFCGYGINVSSGGVFCTVVGIPHKFFDLCPDCGQQYTGPRSAYCSETGKPHFKKNNFPAQNKNLSRRLPSALLLGSWPWERLGNELYLPNTKSQEVFISQLLHDAGRAVLTQQVRAAFQASKRNHSIKKKTYPQKDEIVTDKDCPISKVKKK